MGAKSWFSYNPAGSVDENLDLSKHEEGGFSWRESILPASKYIEKFSLLRKS